MADIQYRAYISYSHRDEAWAAWLHHALESYKVPARLVGRESSVGEVPARIRPVFRDRDDLSSATDLGQTVKQALADSENLIVLCSPAAAASTWVGEEIRQFARLGRANRVFCIIVDGEPAEDGSVSACFPPALAEIGHTEPLAADVRKWADGKRVAKLKLIAGLLGIRLDELRQRDLQRRRKRQLISGLGIAAALTLAVITVVSQISERHEREKAEQLATFVVDLGERLQSDADLETLALISGEASRHLQDLDPDRLSADTGKKVALALRQMGRVSQYQGKPEDALEAFTRSRDFLSGLYKKFPDNADVLFELGNAEYYIGNLHYAQGQYDIAMESMQTYHRLASKLLESDPGNPDWMLELSYSHNNLAAVQLEGGYKINEETLKHIAEAVRLMEEVVALRPEDKAVASVYANTLAWAADAQLQTCNLEGALTSRTRSKQLAEFSMLADPGNNDLKKNHAYALTGLARVQSFTGQLDFAVQNLELAVSELQQLFAADTSNFHYRDEARDRRVMLAKLLAETGQLELARSMLQELEKEFEYTGEFIDQNGYFRKELINFLLAYTDIESRLGNVESAREYLNTVIKLQSDSLNTAAAGIFDALRLVDSRYLWWQLNGHVFDGLPPIPVFNQSAGSEFQSCTAAEAATRMYAFEGDNESAAKQADYLKAKGYANPAYIRFCKKHGLCS
jgi:tetratricopeptide (TPR) repeat protein